MPDSTSDTRPSERELRKRLADDVRRVDEIRPKLGTGKATGHEVRELAEAARRARSTHEELRVRRAERASDGGALRSAWRWGRRSHPLTQVRELEGRVLDGVTLADANLTDEEVAELRTFLKVRYGYDDPTPEQSARYEALVGKAAGEAGVLDRRRDEVTKEDEMRAEATKLARAFLPVRRDPEPGSVELPRFVFDWLTNGEADTFDLTDLGLLAGLVYSFANESGALFVNGGFEVADDGPRIVVGKGGSAGLRLVAGADDTQRVQVRAHLANLRRNGWAEVEVVRGVTTIRPGERMRKLWPKARG